MKKLELKSEASPFRDIAIKVEGATDYLAPLEEVSFRESEVITELVVQMLERAIRQAVEATNQAVIKEWNQAMTSSAFDKRLHQLDYLEIAELMAEKERT